MTDRDAKGHVPRGERNGQAKLTALNVQNIRRLLAHSVLTQDEIGQRFGVSSAAIRDIKFGRKWAWLEEAPDGD
jgi:hypothetical protein